jgi:hypothetical protein
MADDGTEKFTVVEHVNAHGGGFYGHKYYGFTRDHAKFLLEANYDHAERYIRYINALYEDGGITDEEKFMVLQHLKRAYTILHTALDTVLLNGDEINRKLTLNKQG